MGKEFADKRVLVTGATRGIGKAIAVMFNEQGAEVIGTGKKARKHPPPWLAEYRAYDFLYEPSIEGLCQYIEGFDRLDILVQNAGINVNNPVWKVTKPDFLQIMRVNLEAPLLISRSVCKLMRRQEVIDWPKGHIVSVSSIWGLAGKARRSAYSASKAALIGMTRSMAADMAPDVLINAVAPGFTRTELTNATLTTFEQKELKREIPLQRFAEPKEIAALVAFLCSRANTYITGQVITIDGGYTNVRL